MDYSALMVELRRSALLAGDRIMEIYGSDDFEVRAKSDDSPVTEADEAADALISARLREAFPDVPLVTEEQAGSHDINARTFLIVDPLDGTKEFVQRRGDFTVNIALVEDGVPVRGVVYAPAKGGCSTPRRQAGAWRKPALSIPKRSARLRRSGFARPTTALFVVASKSHRDAATDDYISKYEVADLKSAGSSLKFCLVATGEADLYPRLGRTMEWDTAAGDAVLRGAGGTVVRFDDHAPFDYGKPGFANGFFIAHAPGVDLKAP
jgi:3'(2'), 5'-bisphosphate nucleotidase